MTIWPRTAKRKRRSVFFYPTTYLHSNDGDDTIEDFLHFLKVHRKSYPTNLVTGSLNVNSLRNKFETVKYIAVNNLVDTYSTSLGCRRQPSLACHAWNHGKSPKSSPLSQQCRFHCHTWSAGESHYCVNSKGFMKFGTHANEESDEYQQK